MQKQGERIRVTQVRSTARRVPSVCRTIEALGLGRIGASREYGWNQSLQGMLEKVRHMIKVSKL